MATTSLMDQKAYISDIYTFQSKFVEHWNHKEPDNYCLKGSIFGCCCFFYCYYYLRSHYLLHKPTIDNLLGYCVVKNPSKIPSITCGSFNKIKKSNLKHLDFLFVLLEGHLLKSVNLQYNTLGRLDVGTNEASTKRLMFQELFFFHDFLQIFLQNSFQFIFLFFHKITKMKIKSFECPKSNKV